MCVSVSSLVVFVAVVVFKRTKANLCFYLFYFIFAFIYKFLFSKCVRSDEADSSPASPFKPQRHATPAHVPTALELKLAVCV